MNNLTYKQAGVDIHRAGIFKGKIKSVIKSSFRSEVLRGIGGFGSFFKFNKDKYRQPVLVSSADGVGTKLRVAILADRHDTVGIDAVAMNVNDILCTGAEPLFFLDYIAFSKLKEKTLVDIVKGLNQGCIQAACSLIGGETAQMPGMYKEGDYDIAGFCVGVAERKKIIDGSAIRAGDLIIGLEASGLHSNGYSLVRKVFSENELKKLSGELLKPTRIYVKPVLELLRDTQSAGRNTVIRGISNITGGAFYDKIARIIPAHLSAEIQKGSWVVPKIFQVIQAKGMITDKEIYHTLNMGIGMVLIVDAQAAKTITAKLSRMRLRSWIIGKIYKGIKSVAVV